MRELTYCADSRTARTPILRELPYCADSQTARTPRPRRPSAYATCAVSAVFRIMGVRAVREFAPFGSSRRSGVRAVREFAPFGSSRRSGVRAVRNSASYGSSRPSSGLCPTRRTNSASMPLPSFLDREHSIAGEHYSRWLVPPAALAIHLSIGQAYAFSVFNLPLSQQLGVTRSLPGDWKLSTIGWVFSLAIVFLGLSAALFGSWLDRAGPRKAMFVSALCFGGGFEVAAIGVATHQFWLLLLGYGVLGGIGLGLGYISPVTTLIRWFPDRPGMATGMAIMGFGGGAMIASPLSTTLMAYFKTGQAPGVASTFVTLGILYFCFMMFGVF